MKSLFLREGPQAQLIWGWECMMLISCTVRANRRLFHLAAERPERYRRSFHRRDATQSLRENSQLVK